MIPFAFLALVTNTLALPYSTPANETVRKDIAEGWKPILNNEDGATCSALAVVFARGTFDTGNLGTWVGSYFGEALVEEHSDVAFQGVPRDAYAADMDENLEKGGSVTCAEWVGDAVNAYAKKCPKTKIAISGWSQGANCAYTSFDHVSYTAAKQVTAMVTFGDSFQHWENDIDYPDLPFDTRHIQLCNDDPTCGKPLPNMGETAEEFIEDIRDIWSGFESPFLNEEQAAELKEMGVGFLGLIEERKDTLMARDIRNGNLGRWQLVPNHFLYGLDGSAKRAAQRL